MTCPPLAVDLGPWNAEGKPEVARGTRFHTALTASLQNPRDRRVALIESVHPDQHRFHIEWIDLDAAPFDRVFGRSREAQLARGKVDAAHPNGKPERAARHRARRIELAVPCRRIESRTGPLEVTDAPGLFRALVVA